jgi:hypothetical protein
MNAPLALVERLEQIALEEYLEEPEELALLVAERQSTLDALMVADVSGLNDDERQEFKSRLRDVLARDQRLLEQLAEKREELLKALEHLRSGRRAANGYAQALSTPPAASSRRFG